MVHFISTYTRNDSNPSLVWTFIFILFTLKETLLTLACMIKYVNRRIFMTRLFSDPLPKLQPHSPSYWTPEVLEGFWRQYRQGDPETMYHPLQEKLLLKLISGPSEFTLPERDKATHGFKKARL